MIVNVRRLEPHSFLEVQGGKGQIASVFLSSPVPVRLYLVDQLNRDRYLARHQFEHLGPGSIRFFGDFVQLPPEWVGAWFAIIENPWGDAVEISERIE